MKQFREFFDIMYVLIQLFKEEDWSDFITKMILADERNGEQQSLIQRV